VGRSAEQVDAIIAQADQLLGRHEADNLTPELRA
jgi:hypothetical protein